MVAARIRPSSSRWRGEPMPAHCPPGGEPPCGAAKVGRPTCDNPRSEPRQYPRASVCRPRLFVGRPPHPRREEIDVADTTAEVTELLQLLIRNSCVNDGRPETGGEARHAGP